MHLIQISDEQFIINGNEIRFPVPLQTLMDIFGPEVVVAKKLKHNTIYTWSSDGVYVYSKDGKMVEGISIQIRKEKKDYAFLPEKDFQGEVTIGNVSIENVWVPKKKKSDDFGERIAGDILLFCDLDENCRITTLSLSAYIPEVIEEPNRYDFKPIEGEYISFTNINFKLCVIQVLMYEKNLLLPVFDIHEFVKRYKRREIDVDAEGYVVIREARHYFEQLQIDKKLAAEITTIYQDGGNDIYMQIIPFWSGETDDFNIQSFDDVDQFPNLKSMTLFYDSNLDQIKKDMSKKGIVVDPL